MGNVMTAAGALTQYRSFTLANFRQVHQLDRLTEDQKFSIEVVGNVLPFKVNNYVINELINWENVPDDPIFRLTFPQKEMLLPEDFDTMAALLKSGATRNEIRQAANTIRLKLNPNPAGQMEHNIPQVDGIKLAGMQHKYPQTVLFFPGQGQTCHAYCTFCFRWPQFVGMSEMKFAMKETDLLVKYLHGHEEVTDVLFTGGDPLVMSTQVLKNYIEPLLAARLPNLRTIRLGTKALGYWPYRFISDPDSQSLLALFRKIRANGINLSIMAHFNHPAELSTEAVRNAIQLIRGTGAQIRTQSPVLRHINDSPDAWAKMWRRQVDLDCIPYYMFIPRDTGARHYFSLPLVEAWDIFRKAYQQVSGVCRTVRGPSMSCGPGKIQLLGVSEVPDEVTTTRIMTLRFIQARNPDWVARPFFAKYDPRAKWLDELKPAFGEDRFFFEDELEQIYKQHLRTDPSAFE
jgi:KamA family protein